MIALVNVLLVLSYLLQVYSKFCGGMTYTVFKLSSNVLGVVSLVLRTAPVTGTARVYTT